VVSVKEPKLLDVLYRETPQGTVRLEVYVMDDEKYEVRTIYPNGEVTILTDYELDYAVDASLEKLARTINKMEAMRH
jgi:hypothetical protein